MIFEFIFICGTLTLTCGPKYLLNMIATCLIYSKYTNSVSKTRMKFIKDKMNIDKRQEFYQNESILNYESVK